MKKLIIPLLGIFLIIGAVVLNSLQKPSADTAASDIETKEPSDNDDNNVSPSADDVDETEDNPDEEIIYYEGHEDGQVEYKPTGWTAGEGTELKKSHEHFLAKDYKNAQYAWNAAYEYGLSSSGEFFIVDHYDLNTDEWVGYTVIIKDRQE